MTSDQSSAMFKPNANSSRKLAACFVQVIQQLSGEMNYPAHKFEESRPHLSFIDCNQFFKQKLLLYFLQLITYAALNELILLRSERAHTHQSLIEQRDRFMLIFMSCWDIFCAASHLRPDMPSVNLCLLFD